MTANTSSLNESLLSDAADEHTRREAAVGWLLGRINYERTAQIPYHQRQLKLDRMRQLLTRLGSPDAGMKIIHVAGTKGKGSTSALIGAVLTAAGFRTGVFTSPHLERIEERFAIDGRPCTSSELVNLIDRLRPLAELMDREALEGEVAGTGPTYFDLATALAIQHFANQQVDFAVLEVGLGGRLDSTNVCLPAVSAITSISRDHTKQLGNTLASIAREKAGIIKPGVPVVSGVTAPEPSEVIARIAREHGCRLMQLDHDFSCRYRPPRIDWPPQAEIADLICGRLDVELPIGEGRIVLDGLPLAALGSHQAVNAAIALAVIGELRHQGCSISTAAMRHGLQHARLPARVEVIAGAPPVILDTAHNVASAGALVETLSACIPGGMPRVLVLSVSRDKEVSKIVRRLVPHFDRFMATEYQDNPRAVPVNRLAEIILDELQAAGRPDRTVEIMPQPAEAWRHICATFTGSELVTITGSFFIAAEMRKLALAARISTPAVPLPNPKHQIPNKFKCSK